MKKEYIVYPLLFAAVLLTTVLAIHRSQPAAVVDQEEGVIQVSQELSSEMFLGEVITLDQPWSSKIRSINLAVNFPPMHKFLAEAQPYLRLSSPQGLIKEWILEDPQQVLDLDQEIDADQVSVELGLFYCREGDEALCLSQKVLFHIPLKMAAQFQPVSLAYQVSEDVF